eukprot:NODE_5392_length_585_cov_280.269811.p2 GENE.NODE_5392_length_585_cov_280.269811~~NODE_5392_length_585_cov_280.269811.p2  ORF type:complete len:143 (-),score=38.60 NODE_5392_length_585_cov_280.269811:139-567(-)
MGRMQVVGSAVGSVVSFGAFLGTATAADYVIDPGAANLLGLFVGAAMNMGMQRRVFLPRATLCRAMVVRYCSAECLILGLQQYLFVQLLPFRDTVSSMMELGGRLPKRHEDDGILLGTLRSGSQAVVFAAVSFPLRRYWVFK